MRATGIALAVLLTVIADAPADATDYQFAPGFAPPGFDGEIFDAIEFNGDLVVGGAFRRVGGTASQKIVRWDGSQWHDMGEPGLLLSYCFSLGVYNGELYAHGFWGGSWRPRYLLKWNGTTWDVVDPMGIAGYLGIIQEMVEYDGELIIAGDVHISSDDAVRRIIAYDGTTFRNLGSDRPSTSFNDSAVPLDMVVYQGKLFVVGDFSTNQSGTAQIRGLAMWNGQTWASVPGGTVENPYAFSEGLRKEGAPNGVGYALCVHNGKLVIAGDFDRVGPVTTSNIAMWDGASFIFEPVAGANDIVRHVASHNGQLFAAGDFSLLGEYPIAGLGRWDGAIWHAMGTGVEGDINKLLDLGSELLVAGDFQRASGVQAARIAWWDGSSFSTNYPISGQGLDGRAEDLLLYDGELVTVGNFKYGGSTELNGIGSWDGANWNQFGSGANGAVVEALTDGSDLVVCGDFTEIDGVPARHVARWNGAAWQSYPDTPGSIDAIGFHNGDLHVGGTIDGTYEAYLNRWDGSAWQDIPLGVDNQSVSLIASYAGQLIVGSRTFPGFHSLAAYNGTGWDPMVTTTGTGVSSIANGKCVYNNELYLTGAYYYVGDYWTEMRTAIWDGANLRHIQPIQADFEGLSGRDLEAAYAMAVWNGEMFVGGAGSYQGGRIWHSDGVAWWKAVANDVNNTVYDLEIYQGSLYLAGSFSSSGTFDSGGDGAGGFVRLMSTATGTSPEYAVDARLDQNYPNPFNPSTTIRFQVRDAGLATLRVYDASGRLVKTLVDGAVSAREAREVSWDGRADNGEAVASGVYFYKLVAPGFTETRKMVLLK